MLVTLIFISFLLCHVRGWRRVVFSLPSFSLVLIDPCGRGGVREHLRERTRTGGTEPLCIHRARSRGPARRHADGAPSARGLAHDGGERGLGRVVHRGEEPCGFTELVR